MRAAEDGGQWWFRERSASKVAGSVFPVRAVFGQQGRRILSDAREGHGQNIQRLSFQAVDKLQDTTQD